MNEQPAELQLRRGFEGAYVQRLGFGDRGPREARRLVEARGQPETLGARQLDPHRLDPLARGRISGGGTGALSAAVSAHASRLGSACAD